MKIIIKKIGKAGFRFSKKVIKSNITNNIYKLKAKLK